MSDISVADAMAVFGLAEGYDEPTLRAAYRAVAVRVHPDKGGSRELFETVKDCYAVLTEHAARMAGSRSHSELKMGFDRDVGVMDSTSRKDARFNISQFNDVFEKNIGANPRSAGYGDWLRANFEPQAPSVPHGVSSEAFNRAFEASAPPAPQMAIVVRPADSASSSLWLTEIGGDVSDFSFGIGFDCRAAHETRISCVDASLARRDESSVDEIRASRARDIEAGMTAAQRQLYEAHEERERALDSARWARESERHRAEAARHSRASMAMISYDRA